MTSKHTDIIFVICFICETIMFILLGIIYYNDVIKNVVDNSSPVEGMESFANKLIEQFKSTIVIKTFNFNSFRIFNTI